MDPVGYIMAYMSAPMGMETLITSHLSCTELGSCCSVPNFAADFTNLRRISLVWMNSTKMSPSMNMAPRQENPSTSFWSASDYRYPFGSISG